MVSTDEAGLEVSDTSTSHGNSKSALLLEPSAWDKTY